MNNKLKTKKEILDDFEEQITKKHRKTFAWYNVIWNRLKLYNVHNHLIRGLIIIFVLLIFYIIYSSLTGPIKYSESETKSNEKWLNMLIETKSGETKQLFYDTLDLLHKHPRFYDKVVNNIQEIEIKPGLCPQACIYYIDFTSPFSLKIPEANFSQKTLVINPRGLKRFDSPEEFASMLVHETDHVEYIESSKSRRAALFIRCNPFLNPNISIFSNLPSITHRIKTLEVCAEKEQIEFHKATETESGYEIKHSFFYQSVLFFLNIFKQIFRLIVLVFKSIF